MRRNFTYFLQICTRIIVYMQFFLSFFPSFFGWGGVGGGVVEYGVYAPEMYVIRDP